MASFVQKATAGDRGAITALYNANKQNLYCLALYLLGDEEQASSAVSAAFREILAGMQSAKLTNPAQFTAFATVKLAEQCKKRTLQKSPKALRVPHGKDFALTANLPVKTKGADELTFLLSTLPALHRYIFLLHTLGGLDTFQIGSVLQIDSDLIAEAIALEEENINLVQSLSGQDFDSSLSQLQALLAQTALETPIPEQAETSCQNAIQAHADAAAPKLKKKKTIRLITICVAVVCIALIVLFGIKAVGESTNTTPSTNSTSSYTDTDTVLPTDSADSTPINSAPALDENLVYYADIEIADYGKITVKLDQKTAPATCANFVNLANTGFYDGLTFHRIMEGFMMQGGCPNGNGGGGSDENVVGEFVANGYNNTLSHTRGAISMARSNDYNSASSQFFIVHEDSTFLDGQYAAFGYVTEGLDIVDAVCTSAQPTDDNGTIPAAAQPVITTITIRTEQAQ